MKTSLWQGWYIWMLGMFQAVVVGGVGVLLTRPVWSFHWWGYAFALAVGTFGLIYVVCSRVLFARRLAAEERERARLERRLGELQQIDDAVQGVITRPTDHEG